MCTLGIIPGVFQFEVRRGLKRICVLEQFDQTRGDRRERGEGVAGCIRPASELPQPFQSEHDHPNSSFLCISGELEVYNALGQEVAILWMRRKRRGHTT